MSASRIKYLFQRYMDQACSPEEKEELMELLQQPEHEAAFKALIVQVAEGTGAERELPEEKAKAILSGILQKDPATVIPLPGRKGGRIAWMRAAAAVVVVAGVTYGLLRKNGSDSAPPVAARSAQPAPIVPGTDKVILTMADGSRLLLDSAQNGAWAQPGNTRIEKQGSVLIYNPGGPAGGNSATAFNTLATPRGGQFRVVLPDGTKVWLNAATSLRFPTAFTGKERVVELTGEAYFEVAKNRQMPFRVQVNDMRVEVLGTHFNINAYAEEPSMNTSLLEGSVQVTHGSFTSRIRPGDQAVVTGKNEAIQVRAADMNAVMAWKNGLFEFNGADVAAILRQVARWYDVEVVYTGTVPARQFEGKISRQAALSDVLRILELSNINLTVEEKKIIVR